MFKTKTIVTIGLLIAMDIVLTRFLSIQTPTIRISFGFIPVALAGMLCGPLWGGAAAATADILGMFILPKGTYFPGFTLSAFTAGVLYGLLLHKKPLSLPRTFLAAGLVVLCVDIVLNTIWLSVMTGQAAMVLFVPRLLKSLLLFPFQVGILQLLWRYLSTARLLPLPGDQKAASTTNHRNPA